MFISTIDFALQELNNRFNEGAMELLLVQLINGYKMFDIDDICKLANTFYPEDFTELEKGNLKTQLQLFELDVPRHPDLKNLLTLSKLCQGLVRVGKSKIYPLVDRLIRLVLTLLVSIATIELTFSAMKLIKTKFHNKMGNEFLSDYLTIYIEKEIAKEFSLESIINDFNAKKECRAQLF